MENKAYSYIRFSTPEQLKGDSLRRQLEETEKYCLENNLQLDTSLNLRDLGLSAFSGSHRTKGSLGKFLQLIEQGKIPVNSTLIVESLDRLSREEVLDALNQFTGIIRAGVTIVTLTDRKVYSTQGIKDNWADLIISITIMARANEESETKSKRLKAAWEQKRKNAAKTKLTTRCPLWMKYDKEKKEFVLLPEPCKAVETIYRMKLDGKGKQAIVKELNQRQDVWKPPISKSNRTGGWQEPYVDKILSDPFVIGTYQPRKRVENSKKAIAGEPIPNYYPAAIPEELYYQVQAMKKGKTSNGGQIGKANNLFVHLVTCGHCNTALHHLNHGRYQYLRCDKNRRNMDVDDKGTKCPAKGGVRYQEVENIIFSNLEELDVTQLLPNQDETVIHLHDLERRITANTQKLLEVEQGIENISDTIFTTKDKTVRQLLEKRLSKAIQETAKLKKDIVKMETEKANASVEVDKFKSNLDTAKEVYTLLNQEQDEQAKIDLRLRLRVELKKLIKNIAIYTLQEPYKAKQEVEPGVYQVMDSRTIDKIRMTFNLGMSKSNKRVIYLKSFAVKQ